MLLGLTIAPGHTTNSSDWLKAIKKKKKKKKWNLDLTKFGDKNLSFSPPFKPIFTNLTLYDQTGDFGALFSLLYGYLSFIETYIKVSLMWSE
jgi:hypothetical protein